MKYVDEFRNRKRPRRCLREIEKLHRKDDICRHRPLSLMEVCGATRIQSSSSGRDHAARCGRARAWTWLPGYACCQWGGSMIVSRLPRPGRDFTTFGDAMRVPGSKKSLLQAKAGGADVRMVYSPSTAQTRRASILRRRLSSSGSDSNTMPSTALTILQAEREGIRIFRCSASHHHHPTIRHSRQPRASNRRFLPGM